MQKTEWKGISSRLYGRITACEDTLHALDVNCVEALEQSGIGCDQTFVDSQNLQYQLASTNSFD